MTRLDVLPGIFAPLLKRRVFDLPPHFALIRKPSPSLQSRIRCCLVVRIYSKCCNREIKNHNSNKYPADLDLHTSIGTFQ